MYAIISIKVAYCPGFDPTKNIDLYNLCTCWIHLSSPSLGNESVISKPLKENDFEFELTEFELGGSNISLQSRAYSRAR